MDDARHALASAALADGGPAGPSVTAWDLVAARTRRLLLPMPAAEHQATPGR